METIRHIKTLAEGEYSTIAGKRVRVAHEDDTTKCCDKCALRLECLEIGKLCGLFYPDSALHYYFKVKKEDKHGS